MVRALEMISFNKFILFALTALLFLPALFGETFGRRHDVVPELYERAGKNGVSGDWPDMGSVVLITFESGEEEEEISTGVLIHPRWVLTAAHNFLDHSMEATTIPPKEWVEVHYGASRRVEAQITGIRRIILHPLWEENEEFGDEWGIDIALLELEEPLRIPIATIIPKQAGLPLGQRVVGSGFGSYEEFYQDEEYDHRGAWENILDRVNRVKSPLGTFQLLGYDFDHPRGSTNSLGIPNIDAEMVLGMGSSDPRPLALEGTSVPGDSGGPLFGKIHGQWMVLGITSHGQDLESDYGDVAVYTGVQPHWDWLRSHIPDLGHPKR